MYHYSVTSVKINIDLVSITNSFFVHEILHETLKIHTFGPMKMIPCKFH